MRNKKYIVLSQVWHFYHQDDLSILNDELFISSTNIVYTLWSFFVSCIWKEAISHHKINISTNHPCKLKLSLFYEILLSSCFEIAYKSSQPHIEYLTLSMCFFHLASKKTSFCILKSKLVYLIWKLALKIRKTLEK